MLFGSSSGAIHSFINRPFGWRDLWRWVRHGLARNPFYILSAALLLLSMRLLSGDSRIFHDEGPQLFFNFSSFQFYELLLVGTAIALARRRIWYDSALLVWLEMMFLFVPFILVSQALLLENKIALAFCLGGCALAAVRMQSLKRWLTGLNMPGALLCMGAALLALNLFCPIWTRHEHQSLSVPAWDSLGSILQRVAWRWIMPVAMGLPLFLPASTRTGEGAPPGVAAFFSRRSFPLLAFLAWMAGTAAHLYCIGFVYGLVWTASLVVPAVWMATWVLWRQRGELDFVPERFADAADGILFAGPVAGALLAACTGDWKLCGWLALFNLPVYGVLANVKRDRRALHLGLISAAIAVAALPHHVVQPSIAPAPIAVKHFNMLWVCLAGYLTLLSMFSRRAKWGFLGGLGLFVTVSLGGPQSPALLHTAVQLGFAFVLVHSLRWQDALETWAKWLRVCAAALLLAHGGAWMTTDPLVAGFATFLTGFVVVCVYFCARGVLGQWDRASCRIRLLA
jgi:hypothetical protein